MKKVMFILIVLFVEWAAAHAQTNVLYGHVSDLSLNPQQSAITLTLEAPNPRVVNGYIIRANPVPTFSDNSGKFSFTNVVWGQYELDISGQPATSLQIFVQTNTVGAVDVSTLATNVFVAPPGVGITTNMQFTFQNVRTNTMYFTNGVLMQVTQP